MAAVLGGHGAHTEVLVVAAIELPTHVAHTLAPVWLAKVPGPQTEQLAEPAAGAALPCAHGWQLLGPVLAKPGLHCVQLL